MYLKYCLSFTLYTVLCTECSNMRTVKEIPEPESTKNSTRVFNISGDVKMDHGEEKVQIQQLFLVTKTFMDYYNLKRILICSNERRERTYVGGLLKSSLVVWNVVSCSSAASTILSLKFDLANEGGCTDGPLGSPCTISRLLILLLCSYDDQNRILKKASDQKYLHRWIWFLRSEEGRSFPHTLYIPLNSMVIFVTRKNYTNELFSLNEIWKPGPSLPFQINEIGFVTLELQSRDALHSFEVDTKTDFDITKLNFERDIFQCLQMGQKSQGRETVPQRSTLDTSAIFCVNEVPLYVRRKNLHGLHFRITTINDTRAHHNFYDEIKRKEIFTGFFGDVWEALRRELNFQYSISTPEDGEFGAREESGHWTGLVGDLIRKEADVIVALLSRTRERSKVVDYTTSLLKFSYRIFGQRSRSNEIMWQVYSSPFSLELWCAIVSALVIFTIALLLVDKYLFCFRSSKMKDKNREETPNFNEPYFLKSWAAITMQGWPSVPNRLLPRLIVWEMYILGIVLYASYSGTLVSFLTVTDDSFPFETLEDLVKTSEYKLGILQGSVLEEVFQTAPFIESWNKLIIPYKNTLADNYNQLISSCFEDPKFLYVGSYEVQMLNIKPPCSIRSMKETLFYNDGSIGLPKHSPYLGLFNYYIGKLGEGGILKKLKEYHYPPPLKCSFSPYRPMTMEQTFTAFLLLASGIFISLAILVIEKLKK